MSETTTHAQGGHLRPGAADDRGGRGDARPHHGEPDPGDPRDLPRHRPVGARSGWPTAARPAPWRSRASTSTRARDFVDRREIATPVIARALDLWERTLKAVESEDLGLVEREIDWVIKWKLIERYRAQHGLPLSHPRIAQLDLAYHDIHRGRGLYYLLEKRGAVARVTTTCQVFEAKSVPAADHPGPAARRVHQAGPGAAPRLHRRLGAPQAQRPGPAHRAVQGPVPCPRRAGDQAHRGHVVRPGPHLAGYFRYPG